jgi:hypothetical protein
MSCRSQDKDLFRSSRVDAGGSILRYFDHLIRSCQHIRRNRQIGLLRGFEIDHELKLLRLFHRQIARFSAFQDLVPVDRRAPMKMAPDDVSPSLQICTLLQQWLGIRSLWRLAHRMLWPLGLLDGFSACL